MLEKLLENFNVLTNEEISELVDMIEKQRGLEDLISKTESFLAKVKEEFKEVSEVTIPDKFAELQISEFKLASGHKVSVKPFVFARIPEDYKQKAFAWLTEHGFEDIIKVNVDTRFAANDYHNALIFAEHLQSAGYNVNLDRNVHPQTLKAFCKRMLDANENIPLDVFGIHVGRKAVIK